MLPGFVLNKREVFVTTMFSNPTIGEKAESYFSNELKE